MASLLGMQMYDDPETVDDAVETEAAEPAEADSDQGDGVLDGFETDLGNIEAALDALDADDLDAAEALVNDLAATEPSTAAEPG